MATVAVALFVVFKLSDISDLEDGNAAIRDALSAISKHRDEYLEAKARNSVQEARIGDAPPQLAGDLEAAARAENIQIAESSERPTVPAGRRYVEHDTDLKIRETDLQSLTNFLGGWRPVRVSSSSPGWRSSTRTRPIRASWTSRRRRPRSSGCTRTRPRRSPAGRTSKTSRSKKE